MVGAAARAEGGTAGGADRRPGSRRQAQARRFGRDRPSGAANSATTAITSAKCCCSAGPTESATIKQVELLGVKVAGAAVAGEVTGSPVVARQTFLGVETPMANPQISGERVRWPMPCRIRWDASHPCELSSVIGVMPAGQTRRAFLAYLELQRARASRPFLHFNCWYDLGAALDEQDLLKSVALFEEKLIRRRGIPLDAFVLDDGWDDFRAGFWTVNQRKFPGGFAKICQAIKRAGSHLGIWISPAGGYGGCAGAAPVGAQGSDWRRRRLVSISIIRPITTGGSTSAPR